MCRWFVYKGHPVLLHDVLVVPTHSIMKQTSDHFMPNLEKSWSILSVLNSTMRNAAINCDGFGMAWYMPEVEATPCLYTTVTPPWQDRNLEQLARKMTSEIVFGHVRAASPGSIIMQQNCHPFGFGRFTWMHNGGIPKFNKLKRKLLPMLSEESYLMIQGTTDSEHAGALFIDQLPGKDPMGEYTLDQLKLALLKTIKILLHLVKTYLPASYHAHCSLNFAVTDGRYIIATRFRDSSEEHPPSLYYTFGESVTVSEDRKYCIGKALQATGCTIIASEPLTYTDNEWLLVPPNHMVLVDEKNSVTLEPIYLGSVVHRCWIKWRHFVSAKKGSHHVQGLPRENSSVKSVSSKLFPPTSICEVASPKKIPRRAASMVTKTALEY